MGRGAGKGAAAGVACAAAGVGQDLGLLRWQGRRCHALQLSLLSCSSTGSPACRGLWIRGWILCGDFSAACSVRERGGALPCLALQSRAVCIVCMCRVPSSRVRVRRRTIEPLCLQPQQCVWVRLMDREACWRAGGVDT